MQKYSENEEKLTNLITQDKNVVNKLYSLDKIEDLKNYLESHGIYFSIEIAIAPLPVHKSKTLFLLSFLILKNWV